MATSAEGDPVLALEALKVARPGIRAVFLANSQGRFLGSTALSGQEKVQIAGISAACSAIASKGVTDLHLGSLSQIHIAADDGSILLVRVGSKAILTVLLAANVEISTILPEARRVAGRLETSV